MEEATENSQEENEEYYDHQEILVDPKQSPLRIDKFLMDRLYKVTRNKIQNAIRAGGVLVDNQQVKPNFKVKPGHKISVVFPRYSNAETELQPQDIPLDIRYEDDELAVVFKPPGMVVHPGVGHPDGTLVNALAYHFKDLPIADGNFRERMGLVHRIDKNTSGLLVIAKTDYAMSHLAKQFFDHTIERTYQGIVWGEPDPVADTIETFIARDTRHRKRFMAITDEEKGKWAITHYKMLESLYYISLMEFKLETGRTHQIRVHMKHRGHPMFNDDLYDGDRVVKGTIFSKYKLFVERMFRTMPRHALHAKSLGFTHPATGERMDFDTDLPEDMQAVLEAWRRYLKGRQREMS